MAALKSDKAPVQFKPALVLQTTKRIEAQTSNPRRELTLIFYIVYQERAI
jgi:hypothetical protein